jgi:NAD(P)-dependent dehydrogenase (short-subunit alcohol dehydrogenase family)
VEKQSFKSDLKFSGKTVVVTGSGTGIGQAIAKKFAEQGANIVIMGRRKEPLDQTAGILNGIIASAGSSGKVAMFPGVDVSDEAGSLAESTLSSTTQAFPARSRLLQTQASKSSATQLPST